tara:strand:+ start:3882 stop:4145 length:264 start_codon:yes stop_codon:yes gene_type:complete
MMNISLELTLFSLQDDFGEQIINLIRKLRIVGLRVLGNPLNTEIYQECDQVMPVLHTEVKATLELKGMELLYRKIVKSDQSDYEPHF